MEREEKLKESERTKKRKQRVPSVSPRSPTVSSKDSKDSSSKKKKTNNGALPKNPDIALLVRLFSDECLSLLGFRPEISQGKDTGSAQRFLKKHVGHVSFNPL